MEGNDPPEGAERVPVPQPPDAEGRTQRRTQGGPERVRIEDLSFVVAGVRIQCEVLEVASLSIAPASVRTSTRDGAEGLAPGIPIGMPIEPCIPHAVARTLGYLYLLCFHLGAMKRYVEAYSPKLLGELESDDPALQQRQRPILEATYALERGLADGGRGSLSQPYKAIHARLSSYFNRAGFIEMPSGHYGWRHFFIERGWDAHPPSWMTPYLPAELITKPGSRDVR